MCIHTQGAPLFPYHVVERIGWIVNDGEQFVQRLPVPHRLKPLQFMAYHGFSLADDFVNPPDVSGTDSAPPTHSLSGHLLFVQQSLQITGDPELIVGITVNSPDCDGGFLTEVNVRGDAICEVVDVVSMWVTENVPVWEIYL